MRNEPAVRKDTFGADLANALLLRPVYRKPVKRRPNCDSDIHETPVAAVVAGRFRNYYQPNPESVKANYCQRCADGMPSGMFTAEKEIT